MAPAWWVWGVPHSHVAVRNTLAFSDIHCGKGSTQPIWIQLLREQNRQIFLFCLNPSSSHHACHFLSLSANPSDEKPSKTSRNWVNWGLVTKVEAQTCKEKHSSIWLTYAHSLCSVCIFNKVQRYCLQEGLPQSEWRQLKREQLCVPWLMEKRWLGSLIDDTQYLSACLQQQAWLPNSLRIQKAKGFSFWAWNNSRPSRNPLLHCLLDEMMPCQFSLWFSSQIRMPETPAVGLLTSPEKACHLNIPPGGASDKEPAC